MHLRFAAALLVLGALPHTGAASEVAAVAVASYDLTARLDPELQRVEASGTLRWQNASSLPAERLCVHLYLNAFRSADSTFLRGAEPWLAGELASGGWGGIDLGRLRDGADRDLLGRLTFASPDDGNPADATLAWVELAEPVPPGGELTLAMEWTARLPALVDRAGQLDDFAMVAQWYPKVGRRRADGVWSCHQFHATSEFSADFGDYRVALDVPAGWEVGATGMAETAPVEAAGRRRLAFVARGVHDFAWAASPDWAVETRVLPRPGREPVQLRLLLQPSSRRAANRLSGTLAYGLRRLEEQLGPYPYPSLTVVEPPPGGETATAMEYPTLFTLMVSPISDRAFELEETALHELAHQWWQGMVATDEVEEPFLDEGLATYSAARLLAERSGARPPACACSAGACRSPAGRSIPSNSFVSVGAPGGRRTPWRAAPGATATPRATGRSPMTGWRSPWPSSNGCSVARPSTAVSPASPPVAASATPARTTWRASSRPRPARISRSSGTSSRGAPGGSTTPWPRRAASRSGEARSSPAR